ncbi:MAG TPA: NAD-dependent epimerase/dehydratase family protein, partial [Pyrinomonadaceae bacterium]|nr:NAD-dependent epimerase/dehydratase family protein [Pyrinomonadaceae bacterium]
MSTRILVTGAGGFVGRELVRTLSQEYEIWAITHQSAAPDAAANRCFQIDLSQPTAASELRALLPAEPFDTVLHLAAHTPRLGQATLDQLVAANTLGTLRMLAGLQVPPQRFAYFSTIDVYGNVFDDTILDEQSCVAPSTDYAISKYAAERVLASWSMAHGLAATIFRLGQVYGPGDPTNKVIPSFCAAVAAGKPPTISGAGEDIRQPVNVA